MRALHVAKIDKPRPVVVLTRQAMLPYLTNVTVAPITRSIREGLSTQVVVDERNGLHERSAISLDNIATIPMSDLGGFIGWLEATQEQELSAAIMVALDLADPGPSAG